MCKRYWYHCQPSGPPRGSCNRDEGQTVTLGSGLTTRVFIAAIIPCDLYDADSNECEYYGFHDIALRSTSASSPFKCGECQYYDLYKNLEAAGTPIKEADKEEVHSEVVAAAKNTLKELALKQAESEILQATRNGITESEWLHPGVSPEEARRELARGRAREQARQPAIQQARAEPTKRRGGSAIDQDMTNQRTGRGTESTTVTTSRSASREHEFGPRGRQFDSGGQSQSNSRQASSSRNRNSRPNSRGSANTSDTVTPNKNGKGPADSSLIKKRR